jgi:hypothetical protein
MYIYVKLTGEILKNMFLSFLMPLLNRHLVLEYVGLIFLF